MFEPDVSVRLVILQLFFAAICIFLNQKWFLQKCIIVCIVGVVNAIIFITNETLKNKTN